MLKIFKKPTQEDDAMSPLEKLNRDIAEVQDKITQAEANVEAAEQAYEAALVADDEAAAMAQLEALDAAKRTVRLHTDRLPVLESWKPAATKVSAEPGIRARCVELQKKCDEEKELILKYHDLVHELRGVNSRLSNLIAEVGSEIRDLREDIKKANRPYHPAVERFVFHQQCNALLEMGRWHFNGTQERGFTAWDCPPSVRGLDPDAAFEVVKVEEARQAKERAEVDAWNRRHLA